MVSTPIHTPHHTPNYLYVLSFVCRFIGDIHAYINRKPSDNISTYAMSHILGDTIHSIHINNHLIGYGGDFILMAYDASQPVGGFDEDGTFEEDAIIKYTDRKSHINDGIYFGGDAFMNFANSIMGAREHIDSCSNCELLNKKNKNTNSIADTTTTAATTAVAAAPVSFNPIA